MEGVFDALEWASAWQVRVIHVIYWAGGHAGVEKGVFLVGSSVGNKQKAEGNLLAGAPCRPGKWWEAPCFFGLALPFTSCSLNLGEGGLLPIYTRFVRVYKSCQGKRSYCPCFDIKYKICSI